MNPFNPLDKQNLAQSVANALLSRPQIRLSEITRFEGAGVYAIYYTGQFDAYKPIAGQDIPIYVGKALPAGARIGGFKLSSHAGTVLFDRLREHAVSIEQTENPDINDFWCRYLVVDDIWISLTEALLIDQFAPVWNTTVTGFGNHDPGKGRYNQQRSLWDTIHPGRDWAKKLQPSAKSDQQIIAAVTKALQQRMSNSQGAQVTQSER